MKELPVKEHTEQTIHLAQVLQKFIWTSGGTFSHLLQEASAIQNAEKMAALASASGLANFPLSSSDVDDGDSASSAPINPLTATAAVLLATQQKANKANRDLLQKSVAEFAGSDLPDYSDDDDDDDDEEDEEVLFCEFLFYLNFKTWFIDNGDFFFRKSVELINAIKIPFSLKSQAISFFRFSSLKFYIVAQYNI